MRGLNLNALAGRGRAAEAAEVIKTQAEQTALLRRKLSNPELHAIRTHSDAKQRSVDVLASISAQSALARLAVERARAPDVPTVKAGGIPRTLADTAAAAGGTRRLPAAEPPVMRALGAGKLSLYRSVAKQAAAAPVRPLPGAARYFDGAAMGTASFSVATAFIGGVGLAAAATLYYNPWMVDRMRDGTRRFHQRLEGGEFGSRLRALAERLRRENALVSRERLQQASVFAKSVAGSTTPENAEGNE